MLLLYTVNSDISLTDVRLIFYFDLLEDQLRNDNSIRSNIPYQNEMLKKIKPKHVSIDDILEARSERRKNVRLMLKRTRKISEWFYIKEYTELELSW